MSREPIEMDSQSTEPTTEASDDEKLPRRGAIISVSSGETRQSHRSDEEAHKEEEQSDEEAADIENPRTPGEPPVIAKGKSKMALQKVPKLVIEARNINYSIQPKPVKCKRQPEKKILFGVSATFMPGEMTAIMGASGAGKTSFLNVLSGRASGKLEGEVLANGQPRNADFKRLAAYVMQDDLHLGRLTAREILVYTAKLRLPHSVSGEEKMAKVETIIDELGLQKCANTQVGVAGVKRGLSGGEKKRLSVAEELVTDPSAIFLDEPTSGLDSTTASDAISLMKELAESGRTVISTIHQPSSAIFHSFDKLLLMAAGRLIYHGPTHEAVKYFGNLGYKCPKYVNPADYFIDIMEKKDLSTYGLLDKSKLTPKERCDEFIEAWARHVEQDKEKRVSLDTEAVEIRQSRKNRPNFCTQFGLLSSRSLKTTFREPMMTAIKIVQAIILSLLVGLIYLQLDSNQKSFQDRTGALYFILINQAMSPLMSMLYLIPGEFRIYYREYNKHAYGTTAYFLSKIVSIFPTTILSTLIFTVISYFMVGFQTNAANFFIFYACIILVCFISMGLAFAVASGTADTGKSLSIAPLVLIPLMLFGGFFINADTIPVYFIWLKYLSLFKYGFEILAVNEFTGLTFTCEDSELLPTGQCPLQTGEQALDRLSMLDVSVWKNFLILTGMMLFVWILAGILLKLTTKKTKADA